MKTESALSPDREKPLPASPPKAFKKLASSPCLVCLHQSIRDYLCGTAVKLESDDGERTYKVIRISDGKVLSLLVIQTKRGFYFGH